MQSPEFVLTIIIIAVTYVKANPCLLDDIDVPCCAPPAAHYAPLSVDYASKPVCFNPKAALYQKFPLLYRIYAKNCKLFCKKVNGVNVCPPPALAAPKAVACAAPAPLFVPPAPAPAQAPILYSAPAQAPTCAAPAPPPDTVISPEVLNTLLAFSGVSPCQATPLEPALSCA